jgi:benzoyl-CoA reductase/2-hydroxyglutaryl-CoA dehydratase subunit BcrC/BadD/HgdB
MMLRYFERLEANLEAKIANRLDGSNARRKYVLEITRLGKRLYSGRDRVAWCGPLVPFDLLNAMDVTSCFVEFVGGTMATMGAAGPLLEAAEQAGYGTEGCGYHRCVMGATLKGFMPIPDFLIAASSPCSGGLAVLENLAHTFGRDLCILQVPHEETENAVRYLADQLRLMVDFVATRTGIPLDEERLRDAIEKTNRARELMTEIYGFTQRVPCPARGQDLSNFGIVMPLFLGTDAGVEVSRAFRDEFASRVAAGTGGVPGEKVRLLWIQNRIQFRDPVVPLLEEEYQASIVADELNSITWDPMDPDDPFPGMARRMIMIPLCGTVERRVKHLKELAEKYHVDGAINPCHWGCRQGTGARGLIEQGLREIGVPVLNLEVDCVDKRSFAEGQIRTRLEAFMEMLLSRRSWSY